MTHDGRPPRPSIELRCPDCGSAIALDRRPQDSESTGESPTSVRCPMCGKDRPVQAAGVLDEQGRVVQCAGCGGGDFYIQKDFSRQLGCLIFAGTALGSILVGAIWGWIWWWLALAATTLLDAVLFKLLPTVTVCYRCKAIYRGVAAHPGHVPFELHRAEQFDEDSPVMD